MCNSLIASLACSTVWNWIKPLGLKLPGFCLSRTKPHFSHSKRLEWRERRTEPGIVHPPGTRAQEVPERTEVRGVEVVKVDKSRRGVLVALGVSNANLALLDVERFLLRRLVYRSRVRELGERDVCERRVMRLLGV